MMMALVLQSASPAIDHSVAAPKLLNEFITEADLPKKWVRRDRWNGSAVYLTYLRVSVSRTGLPQRCEIATTFGLPEGFDPCSLVLSRAIFQAATDKQGNAIFGMTYVQFFWEHKKWLGQKYDYRLPPDYTFSLSALPLNAPVISDIRLNILSNEDGHVESCSAESSRQARTLSTLACKQIMRMPSRVVKDREGIPVRAVQSAIVSFSLDTTPEKKTASIATLY